MRRTVHTSPASRRRAHRPTADGSYTQSGSPLIETLPSRRALGGTSFPSLHLPHSIPAVCDAALTYTTIAQTTHNAPTHSPFPMTTHMDLDNNPRKRFRSDDDDYPTEDSISKKTRLALFDASPRDSALSPPPPQTDDSSAASTPASLDMEMDTDPFSARVLSAQQPPSTAAATTAAVAAARPGQGRGQGQGCTIIAGWNQARRMELCLQGYPPALRLQLSR